jgi:hypothetical protein
MKHWRIALAFLALSAVPALAQTAAELLVVTSIIGTLDSNIRLPSGSFMVVNPQITNEFANLLGADKNKFDKYTLYLARGLATKLADAYIHNLETSFAAAGYFQSAKNETKVSSETRARYEYENPDNGKTMLLFVVRRADSVYFLVAAKK